MLVINYEVLSFSYCLFQIVKQLWAYIRRNNLQDPSNKRKIICNDELRLVFEVDCTDMFKMNKLLAKHIIPLEPSSMYLWIVASMYPVFISLDHPQLWNDMILYTKDLLIFTLSEQSVPKKPKVDVESGAKSTESSPPVIISETLANFFGVGGREMLQADVFRRIWEYIKVNNLEVGKLYSITL